MTWARYTTRILFFSFLGPDIVGRTEGINSRVRQSLHNYRAIRLGLFKNGDPWFGPINYHFLPGRDVTSLESLFKILSPKMDLMNGKKNFTSIIFSTARKISQGEKSPKRLYTYQISDLASVLILLLSYSRSLQFRNFRQISF